MIVGITISLFLIGAMVALFNWRLGIYLVIAFGFLQDPLRKLMPGEPVIMTVFAAGLFAVCLIGAMIAGENLDFGDIHRWNPILLVPGTLFAFWVVVMATKTVVTTGNPLLAGIGAAAYLSPIPGLLLGYRFARSWKDIESLIIFYLCCNLLFCLSLYFEKAGVAWPVLGSVGEGFVFYPESGGISILYAGLFRSPEVAGWHASTGIMLVMLLVLGKRWKGAWILFALAAVSLLLPALVITGRRKFLAAIVMFMAFSGFFMVYFRYGLGRMAMALLVLGLAVAGFFYYITASELPGDWMAYFERSATTSDDSFDRFHNMTFGMFEYVIQKNGFWGSGAGTGSQGAQHFGGGAVIVGAAAEGGLGKVLAELGLPGLFLIGWLFVAVGLYLLSVAMGIGATQHLAPNIFCLIGFLLANAMVFTTAHQIFGDVFILIFIGLMLGVAMRAPYMAGSVSGNAGNPLKAPSLAAPQEGGPVATTARRRIGRRFPNRGAVQKFGTPS